MRYEWCGSPARAKLETPRALDPKLAPTSPVAGPREDTPKRPPDPPRSGRSRLGAGLSPTSLWEIKYYCEKTQNIFNHCKEI